MSLVAWIHNWERPACPAVCYHALVAKNKSTDAAELKGGEVVEVVHPGADGDQSFIDQQNEALLHYKLTGVNSKGYIDPTRDQEPDIAPEYGVAPHPELANPAPPAASFSGRALDENAIPMVKDVETKEEDAKEATEAFNEALQQREELFEATKDTVVTAPAQPVYVVDAPEQSDVKANTDTPTGDESLALVQTANPAAAASAQKPQDLEAAGVVESKDSKSDDNKS